MGTHAPLGSGAPRATVFKARTRRRGVLPREHTLAARACGAPDSLDSPSPPPFSDWQGCPCATQPVLHSCRSITAAALSQRRLMLSTHSCPLTPRGCPHNARLALRAPPALRTGATCWPALASGSRPFAVWLLHQQAPPLARLACAIAHWPRRAVALGGPGALTSTAIARSTCTHKTLLRARHAPPPQHAAFARPCAECGPPFKHTHKPGTSC